MDVKKFKYLYPVLDFVSAIVAWNLFYFFHQSVTVSGLFNRIFLRGFETYPFAGSIIVPFCWLILYYFSGYYNKPLRKTRLEDLRNTIVHSFIGVFFIFFISVFDVSVGNYGNQYKFFFLLLFIQSIVTILPRIALTSYIIRLKKIGKISFCTLFIGRIARIVQMKSELNDKYPGHGHRFIGYVSVETSVDLINDNGLARLGGIQDLHNLIVNKHIEDVIIVLNEADLNIYKKIIVLLNSSHVELKVNTDLYPVIKGKVNISSLFQYPLIQVSRDLLPLWQSILKNTVDVLGALLGLILTLPVSLTLIAIIKSTSEGPVIYSHERIGRFGKPFRIFKFRSMYKDAEENGPQLAKKDDPRITKVGRFMRRARLDEIPNFFNVLKGDMSLVGPRPERKFYIEQIVEKAPEYKRLLQVKPGVTSWGQVKYGYAENIDEMIRRMRYDLLYIENITLYVDFQILVRTIIIILKGRGI